VFGDATLDIGVGPKCPDVTSIIQFEASQGDWLCARGVETGNFSHITGRSSFMDASNDSSDLQHRPPIKACETAR
jgi:hypothetical protein